MQPLLIILLLNDNHLSNVKTIQSIYKQDYERIILVACNDSTANFQNERFFYNLTVDHGKNIEKIVFHENEYQLGVFKSQKQFWNSIKDGYIFTIHSGEYLTSSHVLKDYIANMERNRNIDAIVAPLDLYSNDFKRKITTITSNGIGKEICDSEVRDCMVLYRASVLQDLSIQVSKHCLNASPFIVKRLCELNKNVLMGKSAICKFSAESVIDSGLDLSETLDFKIYKNINGSKNLDNTIKFDERPANIREIFAFTFRSRILFQVSRYSKIKDYFKILIFFVLLTVVVFATNMENLMVVGKVSFVVTLLLAIWICIMVGVNIYFKKYPLKIGA